MLIDILHSASARISKGQGCLFKEKGREQFWPKKLEKLT
jgi:hypothetical protein